MDGYGKGREKAHAQQFPPAVGMHAFAMRGGRGDGAEVRLRGGAVKRRALNNGMGLMRVFGRRDKVVYDAYERYAAEKRPGVDPMAPVAAVGRHQPGRALY